MCSASVYNQLKYWVIDCRLPEAIFDQRRSELWCVCFAVDSTVADPIMRTDGKYLEGNHYEWVPHRITALSVFLLHLTS